MNEYPGMIPPEQSPGLQAVEARYGKAIADRIRAFPETAQMLGDLHYPESPDIICYEVAQAHEALANCMADEEYALDQAARIVRGERGRSGLVARMMSRRRERFDTDDDRIVQAKYAEAVRNR